jgi:lipopolysaccharide heptosyltransferase III
MRLLFITSNRVGDAVLSTGLLNYLIGQYPTVRITIACGPHATGVFARMPKRERTLVLEKQPWNLHWVPLWARATVRRWDLVVDIRGSALAFMVRAKQRAVMRPQPGDEGRPKVEQLARMLDLNPAPLPVAWVSKEDERLAARLIPRQHSVVGLGPTANWAPKVWPPDRFVALFRAIQDRLLADAVPAVFAGQGEWENDLAAPVLAALPGAIDLAGQLSLPEVAACLRRCALFVGNDSGLMHLAAAAGVPTIGLFGPTPIEQYAPVGPRAAAVRGGSAMEDLSVGAVFATVARLLATAGREVVELTE